MRESRLICSITLLLLANSASAQQWLKIKSSNFELYTTAGEKKGRDAILHFEQVRAAFEKLAKSGFSSTVPVRIIAFQSDKEFKPYAINEFATAYYLGDRERDYIVMRSISPEYYPTAIHEYTHLIVKHSGLTLPIWLNEGVAEVFSTMKPLGKQVWVGELIPGRWRELQSNKLLPLETLTTIDHNSPHYNEKAKAGIFYAESWGLTHMLYFSDQFWKKFGDLLNQIRPDATQEATFQKVYGKSIPELTKDLQGYLRADRFNQAVANVKLEKSAESPEVAPATALESGMALADLLAVTRKTDAARAAYENLATQFPAEVEVPMAQARLAWMNSDHDGIKRYFSRAIELGTKNAKVYFDYAMILRDSKESESEVAPLLRKALELQPDLQEAAYILGYYSMSAGRFGEAVAYFNQVKKIEPKRASSFFRAAAYANYRMGRLEEAKKLAESSLKYAVEPDDSKAARELLDYVGRDPAKPPTEPAPRVSRAANPPRADPAPDETPAPAERRLLRRSEPAEGTLRAEGTLQQVDCLDKVARLRLATGGRQLILLIEDPGDVVITNADAKGGHEFTCGPQKSVPVMIQYILKPDAKNKSEGSVRAIEFR